MTTFAKMKIKELDVDKNHLWIMLLNAKLHANVTKIWIYI